MNDPEPTPPAATDLKELMKPWWEKIPSLFIDGVLYGSIAWFVFSQSYLGGDEAAKWIEPRAKFWLLYWIGSAGTVSGAMKMFRSTAFSQYQTEKKAANGGQPPASNGATPEPPKT